MLGRVSILPTDYGRLTASKIAVFLPFFASKTNSSRLGHIPIFRLCQSGVQRNCCRKGLLIACCQKCLCVGFVRNKPRIADSTIRGKCYSAIICISAPRMVIESISLTSNIGSVAINMYRIFPPLVSSVPLENEQIVLPLSSVNSPLS